MQRRFRTQDTNVPHERCYSCLKPIPITRKYCSPACRNLPNMLKELMRKLVLNGYTVSSEDFDLFPETFSDTEYCAWRKQIFWLVFKPFK